MTEHLPPDFPTDDALRDWLVGETAAGPCPVESWAAGDDTRRVWLERLRAAYADVHTEPRSVDVAAAYAQVAGQVGLRKHDFQARSGSDTTSTRRTFGTRRIASARSSGGFAPGSLRRYVHTGIAAGAVAILALAGIVQVKDRLTQPIALPKRTFATTAGERAELTLRDGTRVVLAPQSTLVMEGSVGTLVGEAYFTVTHDAGRAFAVRTGDVTTRVLGTAFAVRRYADESTTRVIVTEGKVAVSGAQSGTQVTTLTAGAIAYVTDSTIASTRIDDPAKLTNWTKGRLLFQNVPVSEVLSAIERWYGVTFRVSDSTLKAERLTATIDVRRDRTQTLSVLASVLEVDMTTVGDTVTLVPQSGHVRRVIPRKNTIFTPSSGVGR